MSKLPINDVLPEIQDTLATQRRAVLQAPPGAGKTTMVPIALLDQPWLHDKQIIMLEPRRLAARNAASRMAFLLNEKVGQTIGYQIRQDSCFSKKTKILVVTEGILTRKLQADPELGAAALVIFDEFHERSLHADLSLALCLQSQQILHEDLKILVMSATLNTRAISGLLDGAPIIQSEGRSFPVEIRYADKQITRTDRRLLIKNLSNTIRQVIHEHTGNCLVFLPGVGEIKQLESTLKEYLDSEKIDNILLAPLHGSMPKQHQDQAISSPPANVRKIVLATNIAETSLTIDGISCVIDSGLERILDYSPSTAMNRLITQAISQDSAEQRSGRAGRLSAGICYRLWTAQQQQRMVKHSIAEILHSDLSTLVLELANWGVSQVDELHWLDTPPCSAIEQSKDLLKQLRAIDSSGKVTQHGRDMLKLGTHPRLAHMILNAIALGQPYNACLIAALLTERDLYLAGSDKSYDIQDRLDILHRIQAARNNCKLIGVDKQQCRRIIQTADDFFRRLQHGSNALHDNASKQSNNESAGSDELTGALLAFAYPDRIAKQRRFNDTRYLLSNGKGAVIPAHLQHHLYDYIVITSLDAKQRESSIYLAAEVTAQQLDDYFSDQIIKTEETKWNPEQQRVETNQTTSVGKLILQQKTITTEDKEAIQQCLIQAIQDTGLQVLNWSPQAIGLKQRIQFINEHISNDATLKNQFGDDVLPDFSDACLLSTLAIWLKPYLNDENSFKRCQKLDLYKLLLNQLDWQQQQLIDKLAPEKINVPSGSSIRIDYSDAQTPVLAVRLQEVFGMYDTPTLLAGHCKLMMHLLSPARRPMQVTQDLNSFWKTAYHEVKKELRGKYKKHYWPDDPLTATATSKTKKQMNR